MKIDSIKFETFALDHPRADLGTGCVITMFPEGQDHNGLKLSAVACCSRNDKFTEYGKKLAFQRAISPLRVELRTQLWKEFSQKFPEAYRSREQRDIKYHEEYNIHD